jgi:hypothetical protein
MEGADDPNLWSVWAAARACSCPGSPRRRGPQLEPRARGCHLAGTEAGDG